MTLSGLWDCLSSGGITLTAEGDGIRAEPRAALTDAMRNGIRTHRAAILAHLRADLFALIDRVAAYYKTPAEDLAEMKRLALADPQAARECFTTDLASFGGRP